MSVSDSSLEKKLECIIYPCTVELTPDAKIQESGDEYVVNFRSYIAVIWPNNSRRLICTRSLSHIRISHQAAVLLERKIHISLL